MKNYVYDIETYLNFFCCVFVHKDQTIVFEISGRKNDYDKLVKFYNSDNIKHAIGYNNLAFDGQVMEMLVHKYPKYRRLQGSELVKIIYSFAQETIEKSNQKNTFPTYPEWKMSVPQMDLYKMNGYNNKNKRTSLKWLEFTTRWGRVQDLPFAHNRNVKPEHFDSIIDYCINDVNATRHFAKASEDLIKLRVSQDKQYPDLRLLNKSDSSVGETLFLHFMSEEMGVDKKELKDEQTRRDSLHINDILLPYINFKTPEFNKVLDFYKSQTWYLGKKIKTSVMYKGIKYDYGEGGLKYVASSFERMK